MCSTLSSLIVDFQAAFKSKTPGSAAFLRFGTLLCFCHSRHVQLFHSKSNPKPCPKPETPNRNLMNLYVGVSQGSGSPRYPRRC